MAKSRLLVFSSSTNEREKVFLALNIGKIIKKGSVFTGEFLEMMMDGQGVLETDEYKYEGWFKKDMKWGEGTIFWYFVF